MWAKVVACIAVFFCFPACYALIYPSPKLGVSFSPAGLLMPFHVGAAEQLRRFKIIDDTTALAGSSGGALAAISAGLNLDSEVLLSSTANIAKKCRDDGPRNALRKALEEEFRSALPADCCDMLRKRSAPCYIAYTEVKPFLKPHYVSEFNDRDDVIEVLSASCNVPFYFDGNKLCVNVRGSYGIDGLFSTDVNRFGCPPTGATDLEILISPYSFSTLFAPHLAKPANSSCKYALITPHLLTNKTDWPFSLVDVLQMSLNAPKARTVGNAAVSDAEIDETYRILYDAGRAAVRVWYEQHQLEPQTSEKVREEKESMQHSDHFHVVIRGLVHLFHLMNR